MMKKSAKNVTCRRPERMDNTTSGHISIVRTTGTLPKKHPAMIIRWKKKQPVNRRATDNKRADIPSIKRWHHRDCLPPSLDG